MPMHFFISLYTGTFVFNQASFMNGKVRTSLML